MDAVTQEVQPECPAADESDFRVIWVIRVSRVIRFIRVLRCEVCSFLRVVMALRFDGCEGEV